MSGSIWVLIPICGILGWVLTTWIRARHGYPLTDDNGKTIHPSGFDADATRKLLESELAARDQTIANLKERVEILERIITDSAGHLGQENERLRA